MLGFTLTRRANLCVALCLLSGATLCVVAQHRRTSRRPTQESTSVAFSTQSFDPSISSLPPNFWGHNASELYKRLAGRNQALAKGEFETTESHGHRMEAEAAKSLLGSLTEKSVFAFVRG